MKFARLLLLSGLALAPLPYATNAQSAVVAAPKQTPQTPIVELCKALTKIQGKLQMTPAQRFDLLRPVIAQSFDLPAILRKSVGYKYDSLNEAEKAALLKSFEAFTVAHYVTNFKPDAYAVFNIDDATSEAPEGATLVKTTVRGKDEPVSSATQLSYVVKNEDNKGWKIYDVLVDGSMSQVAIQRSDFRAAFKAGGAQYLTHVLDEKTKAYMAES